MIQLIAATTAQVVHLVPLDELFEVVRAVALRGPVRVTIITDVLSTQRGEDRAAELAIRPSHLEQLVIVGVAAVAAIVVRCIS